MHQSTRHKLNGRNTVIPAARAALADIEKAIKLLSKAVLTLADAQSINDHVVVARKSVGSAAVNAQLYLPDRKRLRVTLAKAADVLAKAIEQANIPVTTGEKVAAKVTRARAKDNGHKQMTLEVR